MKRLVNVPQVDGPNKVKLGVVTGSKMGRATKKILNGTGVVSRSEESCYCT